MKSQKNNWSEANELESQKFTIDNNELTLKSAGFTLSRFLKAATKSKNILYFYNVAWLILNVETDKRQLTQLKN